MPSHHFLCTHTFAGLAPLAYDEMTSDKKLVSPSGDLSSSPEIPDVSKMFSTLSSLSRRLATPSSAAVMKRAATLAPSAATGSHNKTECVFGETRPEKPKTFLLQVLYLKPPVQEEIQVRRARAEGG